MDAFLVLLGLVAIIYFAFRERAKIEATPAGEPRKKPTSFLTWFMTFLLVVMGVNICVPEPPEVVQARIRAKADAIAREREAEANRPVVDEPCGDVAKMFSSRGKLSDLQREELWKNYNGKRFKWKMKLGDVTDDLGLNGHWTCATGSPSMFGSDVVMKYEDQHKPMLLRLEKGSVYEVEGVLDGMMGSVGMFARPIRE